MQIKATIPKNIDHRVETVANGVKGKTALDGMVIDRKLQIDENVELISNKSGDEGKKLREQLEAMEKEVKERKATIQAKAGNLPNTPAASTTPAPTVGAVSLEVAPGPFYTPAMWTARSPRTCLQTLASIRAKQNT